MKFKISHRSFFILGIVFGAAIVFTACSKTEAVKPVNTTAENVAVKGFDTVAYFSENLPKEGKAEFVHEWNGAKWRFSNAENLDLFKQNPEKYARNSAVIVRMRFRTATRRTAIRTLGKSWTANFI